MKKQYRKILIGFTAISSLLVSFSSCEDYLDVDKYFDNVLTLDSAFTKRTYVEGFLSNAFEVMTDEVADIATGGLGGYALWSSDDLLRMDDNNNTKKYQNGEYSASNTLTEDKWKRVYEPVRKTSTFLKYVDLCQEMTMSERADVKAQARFLRAFAYWILLRQYGPLPLIPEEGFDISMSYDQLSVQRNTFEECVATIENDLLLAAQILPPERTANNIGRPTRGAALALRARVLLLAASPLFNGNEELFSMRNYDGVQLIPQTKDESKWAKAAAAALDVIKLDKYKLLTVPFDESKSIAPPIHAEYSNKDFPDGWQDIDPFESYKQMFDGAVAASKNPELIFTRPNDNKNGIDDLNRILMPVTLSGNNSVAVTMKQLKAYYKADGSMPTADDFTKEGFTTQKEGYLPADVSLQYADKEPRFYASIAYSGSIWECESAAENSLKNRQIFYYKDLTDGKKYNNADRFPATGIGMKKYYNREDARTTGGYRVEKFEPAIRYAEVLAMYAEALNELTPGTSYKVASFDGNQEYDIKRDVAQLRFAMKPIRMRAGIPDFTDAIYNSPAQFKLALKRERQIEFFGESKRFYDLRRWKDAMIEENIAITGYNVEMANTNQQKQDFYKETVVAAYPKIFLEKMYLWPIPQYELTRNKRLTQNPGW
ncbi:MAG: RagB/SusD family nutrient uptake outer membrane protein [Prevotella sp.]|jgi:hypothetical protein|nr:RagB/SusD family nutrient uptake outer membrane protein [Prevotella sp.]